MLNMQCVLKKHPETYSFAILTFCPPLSIPIIYAKSLSKSQIASNYEESAFRVIHYSLVPLHTKTIYQVALRFYVSF